MNTPLFSKLHSEGLLSDSSFAKIKAQEGKQLFSLFWEIRVLLYLGILLLTGGLGILVYKNIDSIGHLAVLFFIALVSIGSFIYCFKMKPAFSLEKVKAPNSFFDYVLLLGCLTLIIFIAYLQYQYNVFGDRYGLATFIPMVILFTIAYHFDHLGILSLGITNLAAWAGITVTPLQILKANDFDNENIIITGVLLGIVLIIAGLATTRQNIKAHFEFTYKNFGIHILFISLLAAMFQFEFYFPWFIGLLCVFYYFYRNSIKERSFYYLLVSTLYSYIGMNYVVVRLLDKMDFSGLGPIYLGFIYFIVSAIALVSFLIRNNKKLKAL